MGTTRDITAVDYQRDPDTLRKLAETGRDVFAVAERLAVMTDRSGSEWAAEELRDIVLARDILRAAEAALVLLIEGGGCTVGRRMAERSKTPGMDDVRRVLRLPGVWPPWESALLGAWEAMHHDA
jgi:hypothetical protein